jgi:hypothetical protein
MARTACAQGNQDKPSRKSKPSKRKNTGGKQIPQGIVNFRNKQRLQAPPERELEVRQGVPEALKKRNAAQRETQAQQATKRPTTGGKKPPGEKRREIQAWGGCLEEDHEESEKYRATHPQAPVLKTGQRAL